MIHGILTGSAVFGNEHRQEGREKFIRLIGSAFYAACLVKCYAIFIKLSSENLLLKYLWSDLRSAVSLMFIPLKCTVQICIVSLKFYMKQTSVISLATKMSLCLLFPVQPYRMITEWKMKDIYINVHFSYSAQGHGYWLFRLYHTLVTAQ